MRRNYLLIPLQLILVSCIYIQASRASPLRVWIDEYAFAQGETQILRESVSASNGTVVISGESKVDFLGTKGWHLADKLDIYWTGRKGCYRAFQEPLNTTHAISCVPGTQAITGKSSLVKTLVAAYGSRAYVIIPLSYLLPQQFPALAHAAASSNAAWILKTNKHRGKGVQVAEGAEVLRIAGEKLEDLSYVMAQKFIKNQYLVHGRPFYMRLWAVVAGASPLRAFLFNGGVVVFGSEQDTTQEEASADSMIVNLWIQDRKAAAPWGLHQLQQHIDAETGGPDAFNALHRSIEGAVAASLAAAAPSIRATTAKTRLPGYQQGGFEFLGFDFLVDSDLKPWIVEVNWLPSLARKVIGCAGGTACQQDNPFDIQKEKFVTSLLSLLVQRQQGYEGRVQQAVDAVASMRPHRKPCLSADQLRRVMDARREADLAGQLGFSVLNTAVYQGLECMEDPSSDVCTNILPSSASSANAAGSGTPSSSLIRRVVRTLLSHIPGLASFLPASVAGNPSPMSEYDKLIASWMQPNITYTDIDAVALLGHICDWAPLLDGRSAGDDEQQEAQPNAEL